MAGHKSVDAKGAKNGKKKRQEEHILARLSSPVFPFPISHSPFPIPYPPFSTSTSPSSVQSRRDAFE